ncbi:MAG: hypothetical protein C5S49_01130 [Candidatus Methanogaster sp.]|nr:MAG: hypothetical protein C5S49_01130 [ANME-2 cluster archaeon]
MLQSLVRPCQFSGAFPHAPFQFCCLRTPLCDGFYDLKQQNRIVPDHILPDNTHLLCFFYESSPVNVDFMRDLFEIMELLGRKLLRYELPGKHRSLVLAIYHDRRNEMPAVCKAVAYLRIRRPKRNLRHLHKRPEAALLSFLGRLDQGTEAGRIGKRCQGIAFGRKDHRRDSSGFCKAILDRLEFAYVD